MRTLLTKKRSIVQTACVIVAATCTAAAQMPPSRMTMPAEKQLELIAETDDSITVLDSRGKKVTLARNPRRVLPIYTSYLNVWYECGGTAVGRPSTASARVHENARSLPAVGHVTNPNMEKVFALKPDLVLMRFGFAGHSRIVPILENAGIPYLSLTYENYDDYLRVVDVFTHLTGRDDIRTDSVAAVKARVDSVISLVPGEKKPRVLILFGSAMGVVVKLPGSLVGSMVEDLGGVNIAHDARLTSDEMQIFSMERLVERDPEVVLVQMMGKPSMVKEKIKKDIASSPAWKTISAVKNDRVHYLPLDGFLYKPNKRYPACYLYLAQLLYPEDVK
ncbi:MAG: ABC transporter substrate-binding protein [Chitinivibrionales bacterium]|nr:ABC transporter substrate-binding protein [Chitinivibrionales bacterium]